MSYSEELEKRLDGMTRRWKGVEKKKMFGGLCYLVKGNMCVGVYRDSLIVRAGTERAPALLEEPHARPFDITGRPMKGWVMVDKAGWKGESSLKKWVEAGKSFTETLPPK